MTTSVEMKEQINQQAAAFIDVLEGRRSVRKYDSSYVIPEEEIRELLATATKAPSSSNMQPWRFLVVTDAELKQKLLPIAWNQQQVAEASAIVIVMADLKMYERAEEIYSSAVAAGYMTEEIKNTMIANSTNLYQGLPDERLKEIVVFDTGLVAMQLMLAVRAKGYDTVPMGGYDRDAVKAMFSIPDRYLPTLMLPIGKAAAPGHPTTRLAVEDISFFNGM
ncbi:nitroreductase family protein [Paenibacillus sp. J5C_2022]|uniref:nitroreductase family protein n=1 Tax=Paenibacillus sp. J5C2022 TaxID=2977129 RepID=UPI0021D290D1|nr:nitroreductase family protein [Paenibacillus sp. J5C2022]MCU6709215.1 nitroreductase family protein [Paenibacillus sp. J5C2022]